MSDVLSKAPDSTPTQVEGFLGDRRLSWGKHKKVKVGRVFHNFHCRKCDDQRTFESADELYCLGLGDRAISIDATLKCRACEASVELWFLLGSDDDIFERAPTVRIDRYTENLLDRADRVGSTTGPFADLVKRAQIAYEAQLGAGSMIYLRKIFESITFEVAEIVSIPTKTSNGRSRPFRDVLQKVNEQRNIIPQHFSSNGYQLFSELSDVIHGNSSEDEALQKFKPCLQLVLGVVEEVNRDNVFARAIDDLGWGADKIDKIAGGGIIS
ncbi:hypothetical protein [Mycobacteroides franklinii]|uniref:hypothetical protein n=1 Tax=Mycobacteroides franklinii TaxID=948102 RepID=UPI0010652BA9|nr:hypothetical protein [Mycobacteroides franklinii]